MYVTGARPGERLVLVNRHGARVADLPAGSLGGLVFRGVAPGPGYRVRPAGGGATSRAVTVLPDRSAPPSTRIYDQQIPSSGYGYLTTRDGTKLAIDVRLPGGPGPYPTLIEYSGYGYADPAGAESGISPIATLLGFAVVDVNMRGTGCSGGAFSFFEPLQNLDGYDVIETVAHQPWVLHHKVGMIGISYGGISQLFVAATDPPDLAAIAPLSVIDNTATTLYPGGILNTGFAVPFAQARDFDAEPASPGHGEAWALQRIRAGDRTCRANQVLHTAAVNEVHEIAANRYYVPSVANPLNPDTFVHKIHVPVFLACQWTDEQTGGHCPELAEHFTGTRLKWFTFTNGAHIDSLDPATAVRWYDFLSLFVADRLPDALAGAAGARARCSIRPRWGSAGSTFPADDPIEDEPDYASALAAFERLPPVRDPVRQRRRQLDAGRAGRRRSSSRSRASRCRGRRARVVVSGLGRHACAGAPPGSRRRRRVHVVPGRAAADRLHRQHRRRRAVGRLAELPLDAEPGGHRAVVRDGAAHAATRSWSAPVRSTPGSRPRRPTSTSR